MVLIATAVDTVAEDLAVCQILQIVADFAAEKPGDGIHPAENGEELGDEDVGGVYLPRVRLFVEQDFVQLAVGVRRGVDKDGVEEGERAVRTSEAANLDAPHAHLRRLTYQPDYSGEASRETEREHRPAADAKRETDRIQHLRETPTAARRPDGYFGEPGSVKDCHLLHSSLFFQETLHIDQGIEQSNPEKREQEETAELEERVLLKQETVNGIAEKQCQVYFQEVEENGIHDLLRLC